MKALLHTGPLHFDYTDVSEPDVGPEDVLVRVKACGICGSDVHGYTGETGRRLPPIIMGHEASGVVERVGAEVKGLEPGQRVCFDSTVYCNRCAACRRGEVNRCDQRQVLGVSTPDVKRHGAFAEFVVLPHWTLLPMPESLSFTQAALLEPVAIALHAANRADVQPGDVVFVLGAGPIGLFTLQAAQLKGAAKTIVSDLDATRLDLARELGTDVVVNPNEADVLAVVREATEGRGADVSIEAVGIGVTVRQAIAATRAGGCVTLVGNLEQRTEIPLQEVISKELTLTGSYASSGEYRDAVDLVASGKIDVLRLVSETAPLAEGQRAFDRLRQADEPLMKIVLEPQPA